MPRILFVDNDAASLVLFEEICARMGVESICIQESLNLELILTEFPHVEAVFVDLEMPKMNGYEVLALVRAYPDFQSTPIVACTVHIGEYDNARKLGFDGFIIKPINLDRFPQQVDAILKHQQIWENHPH